MPQPALIEQPMKLIRDFPGARDGSAHDPRRRESSAGSIRRHDDALDPMAPLKESYVGK